MTTAPARIEYATGARLGTWSRVWRYLVVVASGLFAWVIGYGFVATEIETTNASDAASAALFGLALLDAVVFVVATFLLPLRRRAPAVIAITTSLLGAVSAMTYAGPAQLAAVSNATHRRWAPIVANTVAMVGAACAYEYLIPGVALEPVSFWILLPVVIIAAIVPVTFGLYIGARRALLSSLHDRAVEAEHERELQVRAAQAGERTRIAREMHDVLAHRISLVAMHAGALTHREDLTRDETRRTAVLVQDNARLAMAELRQVLGVLKAPDGGVEAPQPTLAALPALFDEARSAGASIDGEGPFAVVGAEDAEREQPPDLVSRTAFRVVQEALTNARKHAPGAPIRVRIGGRPGGLLAVEVTNGSPGRAPGPAGVGGAGMGLAGLAERVGLAGGTIDYGPNGKNGFAVRAWLPWGESTDD
ncbi:sensor histidine kinase [Microbacterium halophytorum]|uniref:sensor histidine kinase n=1 Tax=Microbacterium halophytorum TaxID=2067568 RepID=UPI001319D0EF|nr:histidine kinase [Microbacterium halophytorum]